MVAPIANTVQAVPPPPFIPSNSASNCATIRSMTPPESPDFPLKGVSRVKFALPGSLFHYRGTLVVAYLGWVGLDYNVPLSLPDSA